ncbi:5'-nucleotidase domain-containing protein 4 isoform X1 [Tanacetum coccineum]
MAGTTFTLNFNYAAAIRNPVLNPIIVSVLPNKTCTLTKTTRVRRRADHSVCQCSVDATTNSGVITDDLFCVNTSDDDCDVDYLGESTKGDLNLKYEVGYVFLHVYAGGVEAGINGQTDIAWKGPIEEVARSQALEAEGLLNHLGIQDPSSSRHSPRGIFCTRTLNLRSISAIGYDMDYTLMHYNVMAWEGRAYDYCMENLKTVGFPVDGLAFDPDLVIRGLVIDKEKGNLVKADRFGYVKRAMHGTKLLSTQALSEMYGRELVDLRNESRWEFLNTLFSVSEAVAYMQMVDRFDEGIISPDLGAVGKALFRAHVEGQLKSEIMSKPELFVEPDPELPLALLDQKEACPAGKKLLLITNSDYIYTDKMMRHSFNRFLPNDMNWRDLFEMVIVSARKPEFFQMSHPLYEVVTSDGLMRPCFKARPEDWRREEDLGEQGRRDGAGVEKNVEILVGIAKAERYVIAQGIIVMVRVRAYSIEFNPLSLLTIIFSGTNFYDSFCSKPLVCIHLLWGLYSGGSAQMVENSLGIHGDEILYVGDHIYTDVSVSKVHLRWRTALICRELEEEYNALIHSREHRARLVELINQKEVIGDLFNQLRLALQRRNMGRPAQTLAATHMDDKELTESVQKLLIVMQRLDEKIAPMLEEDGEHFNKRWGYLSRAGLWDKSHLMRQIEKYADIYTSRVSNFLNYTPFMYFRSQEQTLAHDSYSFYQSRIDP